MAQTFLDLVGSRRQTAGPGCALVPLPPGGARGTVNDHREAARAPLGPFTKSSSMHADFGARPQRARIDNA